MRAALATVSSSSDSASRQPPGFQQRLPELDLELDPRPVAFLE